MSGGEAQRLKVVRHLGSSLTGMTYIFDEPSVGMHPRDVDRLNDLLGRLRDKGNTVLVVEHDPDVIGVADHVIDMGPGAGVHGGAVVFAGTVAGLREADTPTGRCLRRTSQIKAPVREPTGWLTVAGAGTHNLKDVTARFPTGVLTVVTGVAGSGKSTLVMKEFVPRHPDSVVVNQSAIAATRRTSPATFIGVMDPVRRLFAKANGVDVGLFSHNSMGACPACDGNGVIFTDLAFMDPVTTTCEMCRGRRYRAEVLDHTLRGRSIVDVLEMTAEEALEFFDEKGVASRLHTLNEVGLAYLTLGRAAAGLAAAAAR